MLRIVQPAISRQMRMLEDELETSLFHRERTGMELTDAGRILLGHAKRVMRELDEARAQIQPAGSVVAGLDLAWGQPVFLKPAAIPLMLM